MRLFIGIPLASQLVAELRSVTGRLQSASDGLRWSRPESWHITLQFLGEVRHRQADCVATALRKLNLAPVPIEVAELGFFDRPGIFYVGVRLTLELVALQQQVTAATGQCGFVGERRPYQAHITLARSRERDGRPAFAALRNKLGQSPNFANFIAPEFLLYESFLGPSGSRYEVRERFTLPAGNA